MKYVVTYGIYGRYIIGIDANNTDEAKQIADKYLYSNEIDMNDVEVVESETIIIEDENGNILWD